MKILKNLFYEKPHRLIFCYLLLFLFLFTITGEARTESAEISVNRTNFNFGAIKDGDTTSFMTGNQNLRISNTGNGTLEWTVTDDQSWLICSPTSGTLTYNQSDTVTVGVAPCGLPAGKYEGTIEIEDKNNSNNKKTVSVYLDYKSNADDNPPFGTFDTPLDNSTVNSSIPVTGWVLDDVSVDNVKIYNGSNYVGDAVLVEGARPDVENSYPDYPLNYKAGWGYMMLTNFLPNGGNGTYQIKVTATDSAGNTTILGTKTIQCNNQNAVKPFGAIDTPSQGGTASGNNFNNWGWVLTPQPKTIPTDGSTINVYVNGVNRGHPKYNLYRQDIEQFFPDYNNSSGASGLFGLDTTGYADGIYTIQWTATDNEGQTDGIGSRYFTINNGSSDNPNARYTAGHKNYYPLNPGEISRMPRNELSPIRLRKGFGDTQPAKEKYPTSDGYINLQMKELDRIELDLVNTSFQSQVIAGYLEVSGRLLPLPTGSTLDIEKGEFYWMPGLAYLGRYHLVFITKNQTAEMSRTDIFITIAPKFQ